MIHNRSPQVFLVVMSSLMVTITAMPQYPPSAYGPPPASSGGYPGGLSSSGGYPGALSSPGGYPNDLSSSYGIPSSPPQGPQGNSGSPPPLGGNAGGGGLPQGTPTEDPRPLIIKKHVFVHVAPDDQSSGVARRILAPIPRERQVNILFVKAPAPAAPDQQIVELPNDGGKKTLIYVLLKKADAASDPDFQLPTPTKASTPEIYFIRYKDGKKPPGDSSTTPAAPEYGVPSGGVAQSPPAPIPVAKYAAPAPAAATAAGGGYPAAPAEQPASGGYQKK